MSTSGGVVQRPDHHCSDDLVISGNSLAYLAKCELLGEASVKNVRGLRSLATKTFQHRVDDAWLLARATAPPSLVAFGSTEPVVLGGKTKWVIAFGLSNNIDGDGVRYYFKADLSV